MKKQRPVVISVVSDVHAGSTVALCPKRVSLDDGGGFQPRKGETDDEIIAALGLCLDVEDPKRPHLTLLPSTGPASVAQRRPA